MVDATGNHIFVLFIHRDLFASTYLLIMKYGVTSAVEIFRRMQTRYLITRVALSLNKQRLCNRKFTMVTGVQ